MKHQRSIDFMIHQLGDHDGPEGRGPFPDLTPCDLSNVDLILRESGIPIPIETGFPSSLVRLEPKSV